MQSVSTLLFLSTAFFSLKKTQHSVIAIKLFLKKSATLRKKKKLFQRLALLTLICLALGYTTLRVLDYCYPPDLSRYRQLSTVVTDRHGAWLRVYLSADDKYRLPVKTALPRDYLNLLIYYEDKDFYQHNGIDWLAVVRAAWQNVSHGRVVSGASTLSMQTARLLMPQPRNLRGKMVQAFRAWQLERRLSKSDILAIYATLAPAGGNREGLTEASHYYLNKPLDKLSLGESAWLVALTQAPEKLSRDQAAAKRARDKVLKRAYDFGALKADRYRQALAEPLALGRYDFSLHAPHITQIAKAKQPDKQQLKTTLDKRLQLALHEVLAQQLPAQHDKANLAGAILDNASGQWLAYVGSADFFSRARQGQVDMLSAVRSPGSTLKPFITLYAFDWLNFQPQTTIDDTPMVAAYRPNNYDGRYQGRLTLAEALSRSRNVPAVRLLRQIKPNYFANALRQQGVKLYFPKGGQANLAMALGGLGVRGRDLARLYSQLANCTFAGATLAKRRACQQVTQILQRSQDGQGRVFFGREPVAFKTGTAYGWRDRWVFAYTKDYTLVLWSGRADGQFAEQRASAETLIPVLRQAVGILPNPPTSAPSTGASQWIANHALPARLRHVKDETAAKQRVSRRDRPQPNGLKILAPLDNSRIELRPHMRLSFHLQGGVPPYVYLLNDSLIAQTPERSYHQGNPSAGSYHLMVIDAKGNSAESHFRLAPTLDAPQPTRRPRWLEKE